MRKTTQLIIMVNLIVWVRIPPSMNLPSTLFGFNIRGVYTETAQDENILQAGGLGAAAPQNEKIADLFTVLVI